MKNETNHTRRLCGLALALVGLVIGIALPMPSNSAASAKQSDFGLVSSASSQENPQSLNRWSSSLTNASAQIVASAPTSPTTVYVAGHGMYKSTDSGTSWKAINNGLENQYGPINVLAMAVDPTNATIVYAAGPDITDPSVTYKAIYKTTDGGESWSVTKYSILPYAIHHTLTIDPVHPNVIYAAGSVGGGALWKSTDNGRGWILVNVGLDSRSTVYTLAIPTNTNVIYVGTESLGVYKSSDGGA